MTAISEVTRATTEGAQGTDDIAIKAGELAERVGSVSSEMNLVNDASLRLMELMKQFKLK